MYYKVRHKHRKCIGCVSDNNSNSIFLMNSHIFDSGLFHKCIKIYFKNNRFLYKFETLDLQFREFHRKSTLFH